MKKAANKVVYCGWLFTAVKGSFVKVNDNLQVGSVNRITEKIPNTKYFPILFMNVDLINSKRRFYKYLILRNTARYLYSRYSFFK